MDEDGDPLHYYGIIQTSTQDVWAKWRPGPRDGNHPKHVGLGVLSNQRLTPIVLNLEVGQWIHVDHSSILG